MIFNVRAGATVQIRKERDRSLHQHLVPSTTFTASQRRRQLFPCLSISRCTFHSCCALNHNTHHPLLSFHFCPPWAVVSSVYLSPHRRLTSHSHRICPEPLLCASVGHDPSLYSTLLFTVIFPSLHLGDFTDPPLLQLVSIPSVPFSVCIFPS